jgi:hypothetical protein
LFAQLECFSSADGFADAIRRRKEIAMSAKCPSCGAYMSYATLESTTIKTSGGKEWNGVFYACPTCNAALGAAIDPIALKADIIEGVAAEMKKLLRH